MLRQQELNLANEASNFILLWGGGEQQEKNVCTYLNERTFEREGKRVHIRLGPAETPGGGRMPGVGVLLGGLPQVSGRAPPAQPRPRKPNPLAERSLWTQ